MKRVFWDARLPLVPTADPALPAPTACATGAMPGRSGFGARTPPLPTRGGRRGGFGGGGSMDPDRHLLDPPAPACEPLSPPLCSCDAAGAEPCCRTVTGGTVPPPCCRRESATFRPPFLTHSSLPPVPPVPPVPPLPRRRQSAGADMRCKSLIDGKRGAPRHSLIAGRSVLPESPETCSPPRPHIMHELS